MLSLVVSQRDTTITATVTQKRRMIEMDLSTDRLLRANHVSVTSSQRNMFTTMGTQHAGCYHYNDLQTKVDDTRSEIDLVRRQRVRMDGRLKGSYQQSKERINALCSEVSKLKARMHGLMQEMGHDASQWQAQSGPLIAASARLTTARQQYLLDVSRQLPQWRTMMQQAEMNNQESPQSKTSPFEATMDLQQHAKSTSHSPRGLHDSVSTLSNKRDVHRFCMKVINV
jgi:outer membrane murein-binding lipoprotein Lpp